MTIKRAFSRAFLPAVLASVSFGAAAADYYITVPLPGKTENLSGISVSLASLGGSSLPGGTLGTPYVGYDLKPLLSVQGDPRYSGYGVRWDIVGGALPAGLVLNANGTISGTPTAPGTASFTVRATYKTKGGQQLYRLEVLNLTVSLAAATPPEALVGTPYSFDLKQYLTVTGGTTSEVTWTVVQSSLPEGLTLRADGTISGTPIAAGSGSLTARANFKSVNGEQSYEVVSLAIDVVLAPGAVPAARINTPYTSYDFRKFLSVSGDPGYAPYTGVNFTATGLPAGMELTPTGTLSGTPTTKNTGAQFNVVASYRGKTGQQTYTIVVKGVYLDVTQIAMGDNHACAVTTTGGVKCWGSNTSGQLGDGTTVESLVPVDVVGISSGALSVSANRLYTCALVAGGGVKCWGKNSDGSLGRGTTSSRGPTPEYVSGLSSGVSSLSLGYDHACATLTVGGVVCWGYNGAGQLGNNTKVSSSVPVAVSGLSGTFSSVGGGDSHTCALSTAGGVYCWGANVNKQLGDNSTTNRLTPVSVVGLSTGVKSIGVGNSHNCAVTTAGGVKCWGAGSWGQMGDGNTVDQAIPVNVTGLASGVASVTSSNRTSCALTAGKVKCWGYALNGQLGTGVGGASSSSVPVDIAGLDGVTKINGGGFSFCAVTATNTAACWGNGSTGQLGNGKKEGQTVPDLVRE